MSVYIAHVCLNSRLRPVQKGINGKEKINHPDFCERGFVDIDPSGYSIGEQCWKYCPACEEKGFPIISQPEKKELSEKQLQNIENMQKIKGLKK